MREKIHTLIYNLIKKKDIILKTTSTVTVIFGLYGYIYIDDKDVVSSVMATMKLFSLQFPEKFNFFTAVASTTAFFTSFFFVSLIFLKKQINKSIAEYLRKEEHIAVFGLSKFHKAFLKDEKLLDEKILITTKEDESSVEDYREMGFGVQIFDPFAFGNNLLNKKLGLAQTKCLLISLGSDKLNIEFAKKIITKFKSIEKNNTCKMIINIEDKDLTSLFHKGFMIDDRKNLHIKTYSYFEECARDLFDTYSIDGDSMQYINSNKSFSSIVIGDNNLIKRVIYKMVALSNFPNQNQHNIYIVNKNATQLLKLIKTYIYYTEDKYDFISLIAVDIDYQTQEFYKDEIWNKENLENIIVGYDDEEINTKIGVLLYERVYIKKAIDKIKMPKILMGLFSESNISDAINDDISEYKNIYTFGNESKLLNVKNLLNDEIDTISKLIHQGYGDKYIPFPPKSDQEEQDAKEKLDANWYDSATLSDKLSNISQARHIDIKLKAMGLRRIKLQSYDKEALLKSNRTNLNNSFKNTTNLLRRDEKISDNNLKLYSEELKKFYDKVGFKVSYFPKSFNSNLFDKMINMEHNRWNTHHYLEGWVYNKEKNKLKKEHDCLLPLEEFNNDNIKITAIYDMYSFLYLPNYLAKTGYLMVKDNKIINIGITGHRKLDRQDEIEKCIKKELEQYKYNEVCLFTPLADGADRLMAKHIKNIQGSKLIVPIPFQQYEYKKDFSKNSIKEFDDILGKNKLIELSNYEHRCNPKPIHNETRKKLYQDTGNYVVDNSDVLFAIWNGKKANGIGGTGNIVEYAKAKNRYIIHINSETLEVKYINKESV